MRRLYTLAKRRREINQNVQVSLGRGGWAYLSQFIQMHVLKKLWKCTCPGIDSKAPLFVKYLCWVKPLRGVSRTLKKTKIERFSIKCFCQTFHLWCLTVYWTRPFFLQKLHPNFSVDCQNTFDKNFDILCLHLMKL